MCSLIVCPISLYCYVRIKRVYYIIIIEPKVMYTVTDIASNVSQWVKVYGGKYF